MYYLLECFGPADQERAAIDRVPAVPGLYWNRGTRFAQPPPAPLEIVLDGDGILVPMFNRGILVWSDPLVETMRRAGADNFDAYDCVLVDPGSGSRHRNYKAINILGLIAAADLTKSAYHASSGRAVIDTDFDSLALDVVKPRGLLLFRLAESLNAIVVHARVRKHIEKSGIPYLDFVTPSDWVG